MKIPDLNGVIDIKSKVFYVKGRCLPLLIQNKASQPGVLKIVRETNLRPGVSEKVYIHIFRSKSAGRDVKCNCSALINSLLPDHITVVDSAVNVIKGLALVNVVNTNDVPTTLGVGRSVAEMYPIEKI